MKGRGHISPLRLRLRAFSRGEEGSTLVEFGLVTAILLLLIFGLIDFSRMSFSYVMASKAASQAVRIAVVSPPVCNGLPERNDRGPMEGNDEEVKFGASCSIDPGLCANPGKISCTASLTDPTVADIWSRIRPIMPSNATEANLRFTYEFTPDMGFLGGPYTPIVTVEIQNLDFEFVTPLGALATAAGAVGMETLGSNFSFPSMSASLPAEALFDGGTS